MIPVPHGTIVIVSTVAMHGRNEQGGRAQLFTRRGRKNAPTGILVFVVNQKRSHARI
jgi:hypothetical protein